MEEISDFPSPGEGLEIVSTMGPAGSKLWARLIRMDHTGHTTLAQWTAEDDAAFADAVQEFGEQQALGYIGTVPDGPGKATHVRELPRDADMVILRRPIAGG